MDAYTDDHIGLMDHLGVRDFMVLGFCIGGRFIWNLLKRTGDRVVAAVPAQPSGYRPEMPSLSRTRSWSMRACTGSSATSDSRRARAAVPDASGAELVPNL